jgi:GntR family transcriptional regulator, transcriptional repressor for pyruvate dehydrogenase complex
VLAGADEIPFRRFRGASDHVADEIQRFIQRRSLQPNDRLGTEAELAEAFGVSRPTLREALRLLASRNLVRAMKGPGGGIFVDSTAEGGMGRSVSDSIAMMLELNSISIEELVDARVLLEAPLARLAAERAHEETTLALRKSVTDAERNVENPAVQQVCNEAFHRTIAHAANNTIIQAVTEWAFEVLEPRLRGFLAPVMDQKAVVAQHRGILRAIERGDGGRAEKLMREHLLYLRELVVMARRYEDAPGASRTTLKAR